MAGHHHEAAIHAPLALLNVPAKTLLLNWIVGHVFSLILLLLLLRNLTRRALVVVNWLHTRVRMALLEANPKTIPPLLLMSSSSSLLINFNCIRPLMLITVHIV